MLEYLVTPSFESIHGGVALDMFQMLTLETKLVTQIKRRERGVSFVVLKRKENDFNDN